ncbi:hypothetical protein [Staphylococcus phage PMBT8]|nr:hypothetical protein [Staphylococcus phage PMBT8]
MKVYEKEYKLNEEAVALQQYYEDLYDDFVVTEINREGIDQHFLIEGKYLGYYFKLPVFSYSVFSKKSDLNISYDKYVTSKVDEYISKVKEIQDKFTEKNGKGEKKYYPETSENEIWEGKSFSDIVLEFAEEVINNKSSHKFKNDILLGILQKGQVVSNVFRQVGKTSTIKYYAEKERLPILVPHKYLKKFYPEFITFTPEELLTRPGLLEGTYLLDDISEDDYYLLLSHSDQSHDFRMTGFIKSKNK